MPSSNKGTCWNNDPSGTPTTKIGQRCTLLPYSSILVRSNCSIATCPYLLSQWLEGWAGPLPHLMTTCQIYNPRLSLSWLFDSVGMTQIEWCIFGSFYKPHLTVKYCNIVCDSHCYKGKATSDYLRWMSSFYISYKFKTHLTSVINLKLV